MGTKKRISISNDNRGNNFVVGEKTEVINKPIKEKVIIGLDISTSCIGICVINSETGALIDLFPVKLISTSIEDFWSKITFTKNLINEKIADNWDIESISVEESAKRFTPGFSSADTIITLAKFNAIICYLFYEKYNLKPNYINVKSARSKLNIKIDYKDKSKTTKQKVFELVLKQFPTYPWIYNKNTGKPTKINEDLCDSVVIAHAAFLTK